MLDRPNPAAHAYDATLWLLAGHVMLHAALTAIMLCYLAARVAAGYASPARPPARPDRRGADRVAVGRFHRSQQPRGARGGLGAGGGRMIEILRLSLPLTVWLTGFIAVYALQGVSCSRHWPGEIDARPVLIAAWGVAVLLQAVTLTAVLYRPSQSRMVQRVATALAATALVAAVWPPCCRH